MKKVERENSKEVLISRTLVVFFLFLLVCFLLYSHNLHSTSQVLTEEEIAFTSQVIEADVLARSIDTEHEEELSVELDQPHGIISDTIPFQDEVLDQNTDIQQDTHDDSEQAQFDITKVELFETDQKFAHLSSYILNFTGDEGELGLVPGRRNTVAFTPVEANDVIRETFLEGSSHQFFRDTVKLFNPGLEDQEITNYINNYQIIKGPLINEYLEIIRSGSLGSTILSLHEDGSISFDSISVTSRLTWSTHRDNQWGSLQRLLREEFFQQHQYNEIVANLYNNGYLTEVAEIGSPEQVVHSISNTQLRAFLELFPQQKYLLDSGFSGNAYNFYVGGIYVDGYSNSPETVNTAYNLLVEFIEADLGISSTPEDFLNHQFVMSVNDAFRLKYMSYYTQLGFSESEVQIWNLIGMKRINYDNPNNSLDIQSLLEFSE